MLRCADEPIPVRMDVFRRAADLRHELSDLFRRYHFNRVPGTDLEIVGIRFFARNVDAHLAANTTLQIDLAPLLRPFDDAPVDRQQLDTIHGTYFPARLTSGAIVGVDNGQ